MNTRTFSSAAILSIAITSVFVAAVSAFPTHARADEARVETRQILPGNGTCAAPVVGNVHPHVYNGSMDSFDLVVRDASYVAVGGIVGAQPFPFKQSSRWGTGVAGEVRMHVDTVSTPVGSGLPVRVTLLSAKGPGAPVCVTVVSFTVAPTNGSTEPPQTQPTLTSHSYAAPASVLAQPVYIRPVPRDVTLNPASTDKGQGPVAHTVTSTSNSILRSIVDACTTRTGSRNLWTILLVLYAVLTAYTAFVKPGILARSAELLAATIVIPFILLVGFWYYAEACRPGQWAQLLTPAIALVGLVIAFWESAELGQALRNE